MARMVETAPGAAEALRQARRWLTQPGAGSAGQARWDNLRAARRRLQAHPYLGTPDPDHPGYRRLAASGYRIIYRVVPDTGDHVTAGDVRILAVFGPGQSEGQP